MPFFEEVCKWEHYRRRRLPFHYLPLKVLPSILCCLSFPVPASLWTQFPFLFLDVPRLTALHGPNMLVCSFTCSNTYSQRTSLRFPAVCSVFVLPFPTVPSNPCLSHKKICINAHLSHKKSIYDVFDNFSLTQTFPIDIVANFLLKKAKKGLFSFPEH
jgi:hypothetical protein